MKRKILLTGLLLVMLSTVVLAGNVTVTRSFSDSTPAAGDTITVTLDMVLTGGAPAAVGVTEIYPDGWTVSDISLGGIEKSTPDRIEWLFWSGGNHVQTQSITYDITVPEEAVVEDEFTFSGTVDDGITTEDTDGDTTVTISETSETTTTTTTTTTSTTTTTVAGGIGVAVSRDISDRSIKRGENSTVTLTMTVTGELTEVTIVEEVPIGWDVALTDNDSADSVVFDDGDGTITYTFTGDGVEDATVEYVVIAADDARLQRYYINGTVNNGSATAAVTGDNLISVISSSGADTFAVAIPSALYANQPITINVTDADSDDPVDKVNIDVYLGTSDTGKKVAYGSTDKNGSFTFTVTESGDYAVYLSQSGYKTLNQKVTVLAGAATTTTIATTTTKATTTTQKVTTTTEAPSTTMVTTTVPEVTTTVPEVTTTVPEVTTTVPEAQGGDNSLLLIAVIVIIIIIVVAYFVTQKGKGKQATDKGKEVKEA